MSLIKSGTSVLLAAGVLVLLGCSGSRPSQNGNESEDKSSGENEAYTDRVKSEGIAGAAAQGVGWEDTITSGDIREQPLSFTEQLLHGQVAGVEVLKHPGGGISVRIRGVNSIMGGSEPLYIVDGMPVLHDTRGEGLRWLNIHDIKKIEIIKDIDARALYGSRGANGVVLISTKLGPSDEECDDENLKCKM